MEIKYDEEVDVLDIGKDVEIDHSTNVDDFIFDIKNEKVVGVEILWASERIGMNKEELNNIRNATIEAEYLPDLVLVTLKIENFERTFELAHKEKLVKLT